MFDEHLDGDQIGLAQVVNETGHVSIVTGVYTECIRILKDNIE